MKALFNCVICVELPEPGGWNWYEPDPLVAVQKKLKALLRQHGFEVHSVKLVKSNVINHNAGGNSHGFGSSLI